MTNTEFHRLIAAADVLIPDAVREALIAQAQADTGHILNDGMSDQMFCDCDFDIEAVCAQKYSPAEVGDYAAVAAQEIYWRALCAALGRNPAPPLS